jgi:myosin-5
MEVGAHVWLRSPQSRWGWVPARIVDREEIIDTTTAAAASGVSSLSSSSALPGGRNFGPSLMTKKKGKQMVRLTLRDDVGRTAGGLQFDDSYNSKQQQQQSSQRQQQHQASKSNHNNHELDYFADVEAFETSLLVELSALSNADHPDVKLRNLTNSDESSDYGGGNGGGGANPSKAPSDLRSPRGMRNRMSYSFVEKENGGGGDDDDHRSGIVVGGVHDLIGLTHLHEPAILHALRLRYDAGIIYTSTGPILIAINPFQKMTELYSTEVMEYYRKQGEGYVGSGNGGGLSGNATPFKQGVTPYKQNGRGSRNNNNTHGTGNDALVKLPPHAYKTADDAYRAMRRGLEDIVLKRGGTGRVGGAVAPADQSILVSGESGAGKTVTTKIVLNYFAMLSGQVNASERLARQQRSNSPKKSKIGSQQQQQQQEGICIEQQVLQSNPILEAFGNAKTLRNDNSSRFGKYIDIQFTSTGQLSGAKIETYLLEKVRLIHPSAGERNYHIFYQFLEAASARERSKFLLDGLDVGDFKLLNGSGSRVRSDGVVDGEMHAEMLDAMVS